VKQSRLKPGHSAPGKLKIGGNL